MSRKIDWDGPFGREPEELPVVVARTRERGVEGLEFRLGDDPRGPIARLVGGQATIATESYSPSCGRDRIQIEAVELVALARVCAAWRAHRVHWGALTGAWGRYRHRPRRYLPGEWTSVSVSQGESIVEETTFRSATPLPDESIAGLPVEVVLENDLGERVGAVVRTELGRCATMVRSSVALSFRWPRRCEDFGDVAKWLIRRSYNNAPGVAGPLWHLRPDGVELDALGCAVIEEAAMEARRLLWG